MSGTELEYCLKRAREEEIKALRCDGDAAAAAHRGLSIRYSARAFMLHAHARIEAAAQNRAA